MTRLTPVSELQGCVFFVFLATLAATWVVERLKDTLENARIPSLSKEVIVLAGNVTRES